MKFFFYLLLVSISFLSCKKETTTTTYLRPSNADTTKNFTSIGTPIGKFGNKIFDIDGNMYKTVIIGNQQWMAENLKTSKYNDGTVIANVSNTIGWSELTNGAWCYYNNEEVNKVRYGKLYNWYVIEANSNAKKNICPNGWHIPSNSEWKTLLDFLEGKSVAGIKMKEAGSKNWYPSNIESTNTSLFTALPGGKRSNDGQFLDVGYAGYAWSSPISSGSSTLIPVSLGLSYDKSIVNIDTVTKNHGNSIRCIKD